MAVWNRLRAPLYQATGSVARDHLASERTFLAWIRTGMGFVTLGIAIDRFSRLEILQASWRPRPVTTADGEKGEVTAEDVDRTTDSQLLVGCLMGLGVGSIVYGTARYFSNMKTLAKGTFRPSYYGSAVLGASVVGLATGVYGSVLRQHGAERKEMKR
ncbi:hypothetical protein GE09DRAFT_1013294 [Coniochaeta sp. 2T2.1]|nr:hypothetical protein GE09DRAFT_1013294 [Coniochaeta sp. 2T2.1]